MLKVERSNPGVAIYFLIKWEGSDKNTTLTFFGQSPWPSSLVCGDGSTMKMDREIEDSNLGMAFRKKKAKRLNRS